MFTGIVMEQGEVLQAPPDLLLSAPVVSPKTAVGDSVAIDGCCLTITFIRGEVLGFHAVPESLRRTTLGDLVSGDRANLELALRAGDRMGGHWVQGHVDGVGELRRLAPEDAAVNMSFAAPPAILRYTIEKGSITVNGVSLTVVSITDELFSVTVVPHTLAVTNLGALDIGGRVNLEADLFAKYVERLALREASGTIEPVPE